MSGLATFVHPDAFLIRETMLALVATFAAASVGSFLCVFYSRAVRSGGDVDLRGILFGRSVCDACGRRLNPVEVLPILTWIVRRGRCACGQALSPEFIAFEIAAIALAVLAVLATGDMVAGAVLGLVGIILFTLSAIDLRTFVLPDPLVATIFGLGAYASATGIMPHDLSAGLVAAALTGLVLLALRYVVSRLRGREVLGLGDVKLASAGAVFAGPDLAPTMILVACALAITYAFAIQFRSRRALRRMRTRRVPFGPALATGIFTVALLGASLRAVGAR